MGTTAFRSPSRDIFEKQGFFESLSYPGDEYSMRRSDRGIFLIGKGKGCRDIIFDG